ncbi:hypothetical protein Patl1_17953 [Pistacia atlantica]|uniref:Uncharacterized protein n=1 Tax=Pistacia atlantica TaxID=434234 RepID=A0ACC1BYH4_9ROSI|nr:hypothetical protein Patl1_17953 [Pistacia atlantica]
MSSSCYEDQNCISEINLGYGTRGSLEYRPVINTPAERVKAKMKLQLAETAEKDETRGMGAGWERFEFNKDAPLDDEEVEAADDDAALVKHIGQSFRFSAIEVLRAISSN